MAKTILAVDDSASIRQMVAFTLKGAGYEVIQAVDGEDALEKANKHTVNLVLTDINMPRMPILMLTTESGDDIKAKGRAAGATGWLVKPFDPKRLLEVIAKVIG